MKSTGFTLLEMLVAMAVFALMSALAYGGLRSVLDAQQQLEGRSQRLQQLQLGLQQLQSDLFQAVPRQVLSPVEQAKVEAAFQGKTESDGAELTLTRAGWRNPAHQARSGLQRVHWQFRQGSLSRYYWRHIDRLESELPQQRVLLTDVKAIQLRFLDETGQWHDQWPASGSEQQQVMPAALEIRLELSDWGLLTRLFEVGS